MVCGTHHLLDSEELLSVLGSVASGVSSSAGLEGVLPEGEKVGEKLKN